MINDTMESAQVQEQDPILVSLHINTGDDILSPVISPDLSEYQLLERHFHQALNYLKWPEESYTENQSQFKRALITLRDKILSHFAAHNEFFDYATCLGIAMSTEKLASKVGEGSVTREDVNEFKRETYPYRTEKWLAVLLGAIVGSALGILTGFAVGGGLGAVLGGVGGALTGASIVGMFACKRDPIIQAESTAYSFIV